MAYLWLPVLQIQTVMKTINKLMLGLLAFVAAPIALQAQDTKTDALIDAKTYIFNANTAMPMRGNSIPLTSYYTLQVGPDTIISDLPYFGRAFSAPINPSEGGIKFISTNFKYETEEGKNGRYEIFIVPKDDKDARQLRLSVSENGYATLSVSSNNKDNISFYGTVTEVPKKKQ
jgi:hypothetical protein